MFDVGFAELFLLALIGLLVLGPERLPAVARTLGGFIRKARLSWISLRRTIESELADADIASSLKQASDEIRQFGKDMPDIAGFTANNPNTESKKPSEAETPATTPPETGEKPEKNPDEDV